MSQVRSPFAGPSEVKGRYERIRNILQPLLIVVFLFLPWVRVAGEPLLLLDFANRHFIIFGINFYSHEAPLLFYFLILILLTIFIVTAIFGRLWCGWTCPQTVFLHSVFNKIEKWVLGPFSKRMTFYNSAESWSKKIKILFLYVVFLLICWVLSHSFVAYFIGSERIVRFIVEGPWQHPVAFSVLAVMTAAFFFNFVFFRERLCMYVCPYGRFQNALIDNNSLVVYYDHVRGEPRGKRQTPDKGDCVDCKRCVTVCPVGIDIRQGFQLDCIACGKCIDACNEIMPKVQRPQHLIRFETGDQKKISVKRFRLVLYSLLFVIFSGAFAWSLGSRAGIDVAITRSHQNSINKRADISNESVVIWQNQFQLHIKNQMQKSVEMTLSLSEKDLKQGYRLLSPAVRMTLAPQQDSKLPAFIEITESDLAKAAIKEDLELIIQVGSEIHIKKIRFMQLK